MENKRVKLYRYIEVFNEKLFCIGESVDWYKVGNKKKREEFKELGVELIVIKKKYIKYFIKEVGLFQGNVILVVFRKGVDSGSLVKILEDLEKEMGILPLFLVNKSRVLSIKYLMELLQESVSKENMSKLLISHLSFFLNSLGFMTKGLIKVIIKNKKS